MPADPQSEDALAFIIDFLKSPRKNGYSSYGYELWLPNVIFAYLVEVEEDRSQPIFHSPRVRPLSPIFYDAAWDLCRRGILRPSVHYNGGQASGDGDGYTLTEAGRGWIQAGAEPIFLLQPQRLARLFAGFEDKFGTGFVQRAQEAVRCHNTGSYLACCSMCGAAAESIILAVAIAKSSSEEMTLRQYQAAGGRRKLIESISANKAVAIAKPFQSATNLLGYWRDEAAHGKASTISESEAHDALARLLRLAQSSNDNWVELTASN